MARDEICNLKKLKIALAHREMTVAQLARKINRSRQTIYFALERPTRYSDAYRLIQEALQ